MLRIHSLKYLMGIALSLAASGCFRGSYPSVGVSNPTAYRNSELNKAEALAGGNRTQHLNRYMAQSTSQPAVPALRMDEMLDSAQRATAVAQVVQTKMALSLAASFEETLTAKPAASGVEPSSGGNASAPAQSGEDNEGEAKDDEGEAGDDVSEAEDAADDGKESASTLPSTAPAVDDLEVPPGEVLPAEAALLNELVKDVKDATLTDSASDQMDRAADFYDAWIIKHLRRVSDSRTVPATRPVGEGNRVADFRSVWLLFQTNIHPGSRPETMTGARLKVIDAFDAKGDKIDVKKIQVVRLHPTRYYDIENSMYSESLADLMILKAAVSYGKVDLTLVREVQRRSEARQRFLTRVSKVASFSDADDGTLGWNFYPSNLVIRKNEWWWRLLGGQEFIVDSYLEGGARDCLVQLLVPRHTTSIKLATYHIYASIDADRRGDNDSERVVLWRYGKEGKDGRKARKIVSQVAQGDYFLVPLPEHDMSEVEQGNSTFSPLISSPSMLQNQTE